MKIFTILCTALLPMVLCAESELGNVVEVAPGVENTQAQMWPRAAWAKESKTWLISWREGHANEFGTDIWCARISEQGKSLDSTGIKICTVKKNQERPWVASNGKDFLVVWEDFRNGNDYDVYAARISADGKVLDPNGFLVAGGNHNQCHPVVAFAGGHYTVAWQAFQKDVRDRYLMHNTRISLDGKVLEPKDTMLTPPGGERDPVDAYANAANAVIAAKDDRVFVGHLITGRRKKGNGSHASIVTIDGKTGIAEGNTRPLSPINKRHIAFLINSSHRMPAFAYGDNGGIFAAPQSKGGAAGNSLMLWMLDADCKEIGDPCKIEGIRGGRFSPLMSAAFDGNKYLLTIDRPTRIRTKQPVMKVYGLSIAKDGSSSPKGIEEKDFVKKAFLISGDNEKDKMQGYACAGPKGICLVTYVEIRGPDDMLVLARLVTSTEDNIQR